MSHDLSVIHIFSLTSHHSLSKFFLNSIKLISEMVMTCFIWANNLMCKQIFGKQKHPMNFLRTETPNRRQTMTRNMGYWKTVPFFTVSHSTYKKSNPKHGVHVRTSYWNYLQPNYLRLLPTHDGIRCNDFIDDCRQNGLLDMILDPIRWFLTFRSWEIGETRFSGRCIDSCTWKNKHNPSYRRPISI